MARDLRLTYPGAIHHVMARSNDQRQLFVDDEDRNEFLRRMALVREMYDIEWRMYTLMGTHFHAKVKVLHENLSLAMQYLLSHFAKWWNRRRSRRGHLLEARFKAPLVEGGWYSRNVIRYIALNPVKANYVENAAGWRWGSHLALAGLEKAPEFLDTAWLAEVFDGPTLRDCQRQYQAFIDNTAGDPIDMVDAVLESSPEFAADIRQIIGARMHRANVSRAYRALGRPDLSSLFANCADACQRNQMVVRAQVVHGYTQSEIALALNLHPNTISKITVAIRRASSQWKRAS
jgi:putative transposase